jgi:hypothetical protein
MSWLLHRGGGMIRLSGAGEMLLACTVAGEAVVSFFGGRGMSQVDYVTAELYFPQPSQLQVGPSIPRWWWVSSVFWVGGAGC